MGSARDWLIDGAPGATTSAEVFAGTCERLVDDGVPLARGETYVRTLHPQFAGRVFVWDRGLDGCRVVEAEHERDLMIASSELRIVFATGEPVRQPARRASHRHVPDDGVLELVEIVALPLRFTSGETHAVAYATARASGFTDKHVAQLARATTPLARMGEILALRRTATNVLAAYVGRDAGARVLAGQIRRGDTKLIEAAIWFSDMRGFTALSNQKSPPDTIATLNELFDCQLPAIERHGGEVLKLIGDGVLAIFTPQGDDAAECCARARDACRDAHAALAERNARAAEPLRFGTALHFGEVAYGNIGGKNRLDFTCIGRAVNLAARLESLTAQLGADVIASEEFARRCGGAMRKLGDYTVKGFAEPIAAYVPVRPPCYERSGMDGGASYGDLLVTSLVVLAVVCVAGFVVVRVVGRLLATGRARGAALLDVIARVPLEPRRALYVVEVANKTLLVGTSEMGLAVLSELDGEVVRARAAAVQRTSFLDLVRNAVRRRSDSGRSPKSEVRSPGSDDRHDAP
jgi:adenylate cyclase